MPYSDAANWVRDLLGKDRTEISDERLVKWFDSAVTKIAAAWTSLPAYSDLAASDVPLVDEALGFFVAAVMRPFLTKEEAVTDLIRYHTLNTHTQFANPTPEKKTITERWIDHAYEVMSRVSAIASDLSDLRAVSLFQASGPRRAQEARGVNSHALVNPLWTVLVDEWAYERDHPSMFWYTGFLPN